MSEQIREQVSAFLDGELPGSETELLLKRLTRDPVLRESFGRYALIGEAIRGASPGLLAQGFAARVNQAIDGEPAPASGVPVGRSARWWRPFAGAAVAAGVAAVAVVALQERAISPSLKPAVAVTAQSTSAPRQPSSSLATRVAGSGPLLAAGTASTGVGVVPREAISYVVPAASREIRSGPLPARLTGYVFAHSRYSSGLDLRGLMTDMLIESDEQQPVVNEAVSRTVP